MSTNDLRGEIAITFGEGTDAKSFVLRPSFSALRKLETHIGMGVLALVQRLGQKDVRITDLAAVVWAGIIGSKIKDPPSLDDVGDMIYEKGMVNVIPVVGSFLTAAITAGHGEGEAKNAVTPT